MTIKAVMKLMLNAKRMSNKKKLEELFNEIYGNKWRSDESTIDIFNNILII